MDKLKLKLAPKKKAASANLDPAVLEIRERILTLLSTEPIGKAISAINYLLTQPADMETRMALLSARIKILRRRTEASKRNETPDRREVLNQVPDPSGLRELPSSLSINLNALKPKLNERVFLHILEACDVNGLHLPKGFKIEVEADQAKKLIAANRAERLETETAKDSTEAEATEDA